ncbi:NYN domain-containing protein [Candidatus Woesearchaeota archaeon]|nr:NYN domain-containing protein [Candidatus Woesearchaeota archaeon]
MKAIIFNDKDNSDRSLNRLNKKRSFDDKRFWKIGLFHGYIFDKVKGLLVNQCSSIELVKTLIYTGEYNPRAINNVKKSCGLKIKEMNELIKKENLLLTKVNSIIGHDELKKEVLEHVNSVKNIFESLKNRYVDAISKQGKNSDGQKAFFSYVRENLLFTELRTTPLVTRDGIIQQKGVDAKFATDLILLAQSNAFDVAILLSGDADLKESIKLIRERYGKLVVVVAYRSPRPEDHIENTISDDLLKECDYFFNLYDFSENEIFKISDKKIPKKELLTNNPPHPSYVDQVYPTGAALVTNRKY